MCSVQQSSVKPASHKLEMNKTIKKKVGGGGGIVKLTRYLLICSPIENQFV